ncbi:MAG: hypothetical protein HRU47_11335 [Verrucomicrobiales bacterium]|nr:hypothetical protein [Verrucomicrobiales bacterium]
MGEAIGSEQTVEAGLQTYQTSRVLRTARVVLGSRLIGDHVYHAEGVAASVRNSVMQSYSANEWFHRLDWLYRGVDYG